MKQNKLFNKCCENVDPKTREEVWKQMDKELGRTELEQAAIDHAFQRVDGDISRFDLQKAFKAGAEWMIERVISWLKENGHIYLYDAEINRGEDYKVDLRISEKCFEDLRKAIK